MKPKIRIKLLDDNLVTQSDRLVDQYTELLTGPKEEHKGPICLEFTLTNTEEVGSIKKYLDKLVGNLPIKQVSKRKSETEEATTESIDIFLEELKHKPKDAVKLIDYLTERKFRFVSALFLEDFNIPVKIKDKHKDKYHFLIKLLKEAKDPLNNKYDPQLVIGIDIIKKKSIRMLIYRDGKYKGFFEKEWPEKKKVNFSKVNLRKFPHYMTIEERAKWRREDYSLQKNPDKAPTKFYLRWKKPIDDCNTKL